MSKPSSAPLLLGVDIGTESVRVLAVDALGIVHRTGRATHTTTHQHPGWAEQDPTAWWAGLRGALTELRNTGVDLSGVAAIGVAATSCTVVFVQSDGTPVRPAMLWMDVRAVDEAAAIEATGDAALDVCSDGVSPEWGPAKALWVQRHEPERYAAADVICEGGDWLIARLCGEWTTNVPAAVTAWYYDARSGAWPSELFERSGLEGLDRKLPRDVLANGVVAGILTDGAAEALGLPAGIPIVQGGIDSVSGMLGVGVTGEGRAALITGSSNVLLALSRATVRATGIWGGYPDAAVPGFDLVVGLHSAGAVTRWLTRDLLGGAHDFAHLERAAAGIPPGSNGLVLLPDFQGNRTPFTEPLARGALWGLSLAHTPAHLYRAAIEGIACASRLALDAMEAAGVRVDEIRACGGATRSTLAMGITADILGRPIAINATADASALGAAMSAAIGASIYPDFSVASDAMGGIERVIEPDENTRAAYDELYDAFKRTYPALLPLMRERGGG